MFHLTVDQTVGYRWHLALCLLCLNRVRDIAVIFALNGHVFHANISQGKIDEDLWRLSNNNVRIMAV